MTSVSRLTSATALAFLFSLMSHAPAAAQGPPAGGGSTTAPMQTGQGFLTGLPRVGVARIPGQGKLLVGRFQEMVRRVRRDELRPVNVNGEVLFRKVTVDAEVRSVALREATVSLAAVRAFDLQGNPVERPALEASLQKNRPVSILFYEYDGDVSGLAGLPVLNTGFRQAFQHDILVLIVPRFREDTAGSRGFPAAESPLP